MEVGDRRSREMPVYRVSGMSRTVPCTEVLSTSVAFQSIIHGMMRT